MFRRSTAFLLMAMIATYPLLTPTGQGAFPASRAMAATLWDDSATEVAAAATGAHLGLSAPSRAGFSSTGDDYTTHSLTAQEEKLFNLINRDRKANGLSPLTLDPALSRIARIKSEDMRDNRYFAHESPTYGKARQMLEHFGYTFRGVGENIAHHATVEKAQAAFMTSAGHRRNILSSTWEKVGVGVCYDKDGYIYATQIFVR